MKKSILALAMLLASPSLLADTWTDPDTGITWTYTVRGGEALLGGGTSVSPAVPISTTGPLVIPSTVDSFVVTKIGNYAFYHCSGLTSVTIPDSVTNIGERAFSSCSGLESMTIPDSVTSIGGYAFNGCSGLAFVTIGTGVTSIGNSAFRKCSGLASVTIPASVTTIGDEAFEECSGLAFVTIPDSVTSIGYDPFVGCFGLSETRIQISDRARWATNAINSKLKGTRRLFENGVAITDFVIPDSVTSIGASAFANCSLTSVTIPDSVTSIGASAFSRCSGLKSVTIPDSVTSVGSSAFEACSGLTSVTISDSVMSIGSFVFAECGNLASVTIPDSVTGIEAKAFYNCSNLMSVTIPDSVTRIESSAFSGCNRLTITIPSSVTRIGELAFNKCGAVFVPRRLFKSFIQEYGLGQFGGFSGTGSPVTVTIVSSAIRENDPTVMDVVYKVTSSNSPVKVRALAFEDGERSFAKVVRPETFVEGTATNIGDSVAANVEHTLSWQVSSDWATRLAKVKFEVLACEGDLLPMEWMTIPATDGRYGTMKVSWNAHSSGQMFDALLWLYADKDPGLTLENGVLKNGSTTLAEGASLYGIRGAYVSGYGYKYTYKAPEFIFSKMGYSVLSGDALAYVNDETRLGLSPDGVRQYAYKIVEDGE